MLCAGEVVFETDATFEQLHKISNEVWDLMEMDKRFDLGRVGDVC